MCQMSQYELFIDDEMLNNKIGLPIDIDHRSLNEKNRRKNVEQVCKKVLKEINIFYATGK